MWYAIGIFVLFMAFMVYVPLSALADTHEIKTDPVQKCGLHCVIETKGFDTTNEAVAFCKDELGLSDKEAVEKIYTIGKSKLFFVDYQITENEANIQ